MWNFNGKHLPFLVLNVKHALLSVEKKIDGTINVLGNAKVVKTLKDLFSSLSVSNWPFIQ